MKLHRALLPSCRPLPHELHALRIDVDTVRGAPWWKEPKCGGETRILVVVTTLLMIPVNVMAGMPET